MRVKSKIVAVLAALMLVFTAATAANASLADFATQSAVYPLHHPSDGVGASIVTRNGFTFHQWMANQYQVENNQTLEQITMRSEVNERATSFGIAAVAQNWAACCTDDYPTNISITADIWHRSGYNWNVWVEDGVKSATLASSGYASDDSVAASWTTPAWDKATIFAGGKPHTVQVQIYWTIVESYVDFETGQTIPFSTKYVTTDTGTVTMS